MRIKKRKKKDERYLPLDDIKKIDDEFLTEIENVKRRLGYIKDLNIIKTFQKVLLDAYNAAIEVKTLDREVDYDIKFAEIKARRDNIKPWRRCWLWRLLLQPLTNRAQDIIEKRAELEAEKRFSSEETELNARANEIYGQNSGKLSERKRKKALKKYLELKRLFETSAEPADVPAEEPPEPPARKPRKAKNTEG